MIAIAIIRSCTGTERAFIVSGTYFPFLGGLRLNDPSLAYSYSRVLSCPQRTETEVTFSNENGAF